MLPTKPTAVVVPATSTPVGAGAEPYPADGTWAEPLMEGGEVIQRVGERILGRVSLDDIYDPFNDELLVAANEQITEEKVERIEAAGIDRVLIRSVLSCRSKRGVCAMCYGRDLGRGPRLR